MSNPTAALAGFASDLTASTLPPEVASDTRRLLLDAIGSALIGWTSAESLMVRDAATTSFGAGTSTVIAGSPSSPLGAAMTNGYLITARSFCDVHRPTLCHVTPVVVPAALAAAERIGADGATLLSGLAAGMEIVLRIGAALDYTEFRKRGWHTPGVAGPLGAAAAVARIEGRSTDVVTAAMGLAGTQASGTFASLGSPAIKFHQARAATAGLLAADLATTGFRAADDILTGSDGGILGTYSNGGHPEKLTAGLGTEWHLGEISTRRWPAAAALQGLIAAILEQDITASEVEALHVSLPPDSYRMNADMGWETPFAAALSTRWVAAVTLLDRAFFLDQLAPQRLSDPTAAHLAQTVEVELDGDLAEGGVDLRVDLRDGSQLHTRLSPDEGAISDWATTSSKLRQAAQGVLPDADADHVIDIVGAMTSLQDIRTLTALLSG